MKTKAVNINNPMAIMTPKENFFYKNIEGVWEPDFEQCSCGSNNIEEAGFWSLSIKSREPSAIFECQDCGHRLYISVISNTGDGIYYSRIQKTAAEV